VAAVDVAHELHVELQVARVEVGDLLEARVAGSARRARESASERFRREFRPNSLQEEILMRPTTLLAAGLLAASPLGAATDDVKIAGVDGRANFDRRFEVFAAGADGGAYHRWQLIGGKGWSDWAALGGARASQVTSQLADGRLFMFSLDGGTLSIRAQSAQSGGWSEAAVSTGQDLRRVAVTSNRDGRLQVLAIGNDGALHELHALGGAPQPRAEDWSQWSVVGGSGLRDLTVARDGDGRVTAAALNEEGGVYLSQQMLPDPDSGWREWLALPVIRTPVLRLVSGKDRKLWLLAIDEHGWLFAASLAPVGATAPPREPEKSTVAPKPVNPKSKVPPKKGSGSTAAKSTVPAPAASASSEAAPGLVLPPGQWESWALVSNQPFVGLSDLATGTNAAGLGEIAGIANSSSIVHMVQAADGTWPQSWSVLPTSDSISEFSTLSLALNAGGESRIFITDRFSGKVFTIAKSAAEDWGGKAWTSLGKIPGAAGPDLDFAAVACLEALLPGELSAEERANKAAELRAAIMEGIGKRIGGAVAGTPLAGLLANVNASARCTPSGERIALWLNHEVWPGVFDEAPSFPPDSLFTYRIPAETLRRVIGDQIDDVTKKVKGIDVDGYSVHLRAPDRLEIDFDAKVLGTKFTAQATAVVSVQGGKPSCKADLTATRPAGLYAIAGTFFVPANAIGQLVQFGDAWEGEELSRAQGSVQMICRLTEAMLTKLFLPRKDPDREPLKMLVVPYTQVGIDEALGLVGSGGKPSLADPHPSVRFGSFPVSPPPYVDSNSLNMAFFALTEDMDTGLDFTWTPSFASSLRLPRHAGLGGGLPNFAFFVFGVEPDPTPKLYDLGTMQLRACDGQKQCAEAVEAVSVMTRKRE
jgi:hypothetical protein